MSDITLSNVEPPRLDSRIVAHPNPDQQLAHEIPRVVTELDEERMREHLDIEMAELGFRKRHIWEAQQALAYYALLSRQYHAKAKDVGIDETENGGYVGRMHAFVNQARKHGCHVRPIKRADRFSLDKVYAKTVNHSRSLTKKMTGGIFGLIVAVIIKTYLLVPLSTELLTPVFGRGNSITKGLFAIVLAAALSYGITFIVRFITMILVSLWPAEEFANCRTSGKVLNSKATKIGLVATSVILVFTLWSFVQLDMTKLGKVKELGAPVWAVSGLALLFLGTVIAYEGFVAYKVLREQQEPESHKHELLDETFMSAIHRIEDETSLARLRTVAMHAQDTWFSFLESLDTIDTSSKKAQAIRLRAMRSVRVMAPSFAKANEKSRNKRFWM